MRKMAQMLDRTHRQIRSMPWLIRFTAATRVLIALGFLPSGWTKLAGNRFTLLGLDNPVGFFFEAFYSNQLWYRSVGLAQILAALLLLVPRTAHLGALLFLPIILNIWLVTVGIHFQGTWVITSLMLLANLWLLAWEWDRLSKMVALRPRGPSSLGDTTFAWIVGCALSGAAAYGVLFGLRVARVDATVGLLGFGVAALAGALLGGVIAWHLRGMSALPDP